MRCDEIPFLMVHFTLLCIQIQQFSPTFSFDTCISFIDGVTPRIPLHQIQDTNLFLLLPKHSFSLSFFKINPSIPQRSSSQQVWLPSNQHHFHFFHFLCFLWSPEFHFTSPPDPTSHLAPRWPWLLLNAWQLVWTWTLACHQITHPTVQPWCLE